MLPTEAQLDTYNHQLCNSAPVRTKRMAVNFKAVHAATVSPAKWCHPLLARQFCFVFPRLFQRVLRQGHWMVKFWTERVQMMRILHHQQQLSYSHLIQDNPGEPVLSQRRDLPQHPLDFCEPDVLLATQSIMSKHNRKTQWLIVLCFISAPHF